MFKDEVLKIMPQDCSDLEKSIFKLEKEKLEKKFSDGELFHIDGNIEIPNIRTSQNNFKNR